MKYLVVFVMILINSILQCQTFTDINAGLPGLWRSSVKWGDYDNDGDLDILLCGMGPIGIVTKIYNNNEGIFTDINADILGIANGDVDWGDFDNDGDLDILLSGYYHDEYARYTARLYRNDSGIFSDINAGLIGDENMSAEWGDYDNDGDLDVLITGHFSVAKIYCNDLGIFHEIETDTDYIGYSAGAWGDYDNDGDLDILMVGCTLSGDAISKIYNNDSGIFTDINANLTGVMYGSVAWGDYDNDGDLDIILSGDEYLDFDNYITKIYRNDAGVFVDINADLVEVSQSSVAWADYDNDGDLDVVITGRYIDFNNEITKIYNNNNGEFFDSNEELPGISNSSVAWGDYDNDGDLDLILSGLGEYDKITKIYRSDSQIQNNNPYAPTNLSSYVSENEITLNWDKASDNETPQDGLSYNLYLGSESHTPDKISPMSDISTGYRRIVNLGNVQQNTTWTIKNLDPGTYYWSVQTVDNNFSGSGFAPEQTVVLTGIEEESLPSTTELFQNYPNPFNPTTNIWYTLQKSDNVNLSVFNSKGELVQNIFDGIKNRGMHSVKFDASELNSGIYFYKLTTDQTTETRKMLLLK